MFSFQQIVRKLRGQGKRILSMCFLLWLIPSLFYYRDDVVENLRTIDIRNVWNQQHPNPVKCEIPELNITALVKKVRNSTDDCLDLKLFGAEQNEHIDGTKWACMDGSQMQPGNCTVYSFGINNDWKFDDHIAQFGCQVYAFDPTMGVEDHNRSENIHFYNLGIANYTGDATIEDKTTKVARFQDIRKRLGHEETVIDYLKVDVEGWEVEMIEDIWTTSRHIFADYVVQIGLEMHYGFTLEQIMDNVNKTVDMLYHLECLGFQTVRQEPNNWVIGDSPLDGQPLHCCNELVLVNQKFF